jgi:hypothetical protein
MAKAGKLKTVIDVPITSLGMELNTYDIAKRGMLVMALDETHSQ